MLKNSILSISLASLSFFSLSSHADTSSNNSSVDKLVAGYGQIAIKANTMNTAPIGDDLTIAINNAIKKMHQKGGGVVLIPSGQWLTGPIVLKSNVNLHLNDDIYLMIVVFVLKGIHFEKKYELFTETERKSLYDEAKAYLAEHRIKVVFNLLVGCHLLNQLDLIKAYPEDVEITTPAFKKEYSQWGQQVNVSEF